MDRPSTIVVFDGICGGQFLWQELQTNDAKVHVIVKWWRLICLSRLFSWPPALLREGHRCLRRWFVWPSLQVQSLRTISKSKYSKITFVDFFSQLNSKRVYSFQYHHKNFVLSRYTIDSTQTRCICFMSKTMQGCPQPDLSFCNQIESFEMWNGTL